MNSIAQNNSVGDANQQSDETLWIDAEFLPLLERAGWTTIDAVMAASDGHCRRALSDRENWRFDLSDGAGGTRRVYLKKHHVRRHPFFCKRKRQPTPAAVETRNVERLRDIGIGSMRVIAFGERFHADGLIESFFLTDELTGFAELQDFIVERFGRMPTEIVRGRDRDLDRLIRDVAEVARRFHRAGYNHRDFYAGHFFVRETAAGKFDIRLIDLQRVQQRRRFHRRWVVKDLAQLAWSFPTGDIGCRHKLAFMRHYLGVEKLRPCDKRLIREVLAKQQRMERRLGEMRGEGRGIRD